MGDDKFVVNSNSEWAEMFTKAELLATMYGGTLTRHVYAKDQKEMTAETTTSDVELKAWNVYFVLRPYLALETAAN